MKRQTLHVLAASLMALAPALTVAKIEAPDHVIYGNVSVFGSPVPAGTVIEMRTHPGGEPLTRYTLGRDPDLGNQFALRIPMDTVEPRSEGRARPGDAVRIFVGTQLAAATTVGEEGVAVRLDLDPQNMGTGPAIQVANGSALEGNSGTSPLSFTVTLNTTSNVPVSLNWQTVNGTATGATACAAGVDFVSDVGTVEVAASTLTQTFAVMLCGDAVIETNETFSVQLSNAVGGVLQTNTATATIIDDDDVPEVIVADTRALEPISGIVDLVFRARLSRPSAIATQFNYATQNLSAIAGSDYSTRTGTALVPAGQTQVEIRVPVLADATTEPREQFRLLLSNPVALRLQRIEAFGDIVDRAFDPAVDPVDETQGPQLAGPSDIVISPDGAHAYVVSESLDAVLVYARNASDGRLTFIARYTAANAGFTGALLDGASDLVLSADGKHVYVAARNANAVVVLERNLTSGVLSYVQNQSSAALLGASAVHLSVDDRHLYVAGGTANTLVAYQRDTATGALTQLEVETNNVNDAADAGPMVIALDRPAGITSSRNGAQVYVASRFGNSVAVFDRNNVGTDAGFGKVSFVSSQRNGLNGVQGIAGAYDLVFGPNDAELYVVGEASNSIAIFDRAANGSLTWRSRLVKGDPGVHGLGGPQAIAIAPDGTEVYVVGFADDSFSIFKRAVTAGGALTAGDLTIQQTFFDDEGQVANIKGPVAVSASGDDAHVYVAANVDNALIVFTRSPATPEIFANGFE